MGRPYLQGRAGPISDTRASRIGFGMDDRSNTIMGWVLGAGICLLGFTSLSGKLFHSESPERPGFAVAGGGGETTADTGPAIETLLATADIAAGQAVFGKCTACHTIAPGGANGIGPNLHGIVGQPIGAHAAGYAYSAALSGHGGNWDWAALNAWLTSPRRFANGTKMSFAGLSDPVERANLMAYLNSQGSNLPLPAVPAPAAAEAPAAAADAAAAVPVAGAPVTGAAPAP